MELYHLFAPITAASSQWEFAPCEALKPYVRCFWYVCRQKNALNSTYTQVIPDGCMDIIFDVDLHNNSVSAAFCGLDDRPYNVENSVDKQRNGYTFGIRFYAWSAVCFSNDILRKTSNSACNAEQLFPFICYELQDCFFISDIGTLISCAEKTLLKHINLQRQNSVVIESLYTILTEYGTVRTEELSRRMFVSRRQLERLFDDYIGMSPKRISSVVRHQLLWQDILSSKYFDVQHILMKYGYADQSHMLKDFRKYHGMNIAEAKTYAAKNVAFLQDISCLK